MLYYCKCFTQTQSQVKIQFEFICYVCRSSRVADAGRAKCIHWVRAASRPVRSPTGCSGFSVAKPQDAAQSVSRRPPMRSPLFRIEPVRSERLCVRKASISELCFVARAQARRHSRSPCPWPHSASHPIWRHATLLTVQSCSLELFFYCKL